MYKLYHLYRLRNPQKGVFEDEEKSQKQVPRVLNFTPTSAKTALVGDPCSPARDDKNNKEPNGAPFDKLRASSEGAPLQNGLSADLDVSAAPP
jgi:hypothetical protein